MCNVLNCVQFLYETFYPIDIYSLNIAEQQKKKQFFKLIIIYFILLFLLKSK